MIGAATIEVASLQLSTKWQRGTAKGKEKKVILGRSRTARARICDHESSICRGHTII